MPRAAQGRVASGGGSKDCWRTGWERWLSTGRHLDRPLHRLRPARPRTSSALRPAARRIPGRTRAAARTLTAGRT